jgi:hypothetical protein
MCAFESGAKPWFWAGSGGFLFGRVFPIVGDRARIGGDGTSGPVDEVQISDPA